MSRIHRSLLVGLFFPALLSASSTWADDATEAGIHLAKGLWIFDVSIRSPLQSAPASQKLKACVGDDPLTAEKLMPWAESRGCKIRNVVAVEDGIKWKIRCNKNGQKSKGSGEFHLVSEQRGDGKSKIQFEMGGRRMSIVTKWKADRVGTCKDPDATDFAPEAVTSESD